MKTIKESIIGRKGITDDKLWLIYPLGSDFVAAKKILSPECMIYPFDSGTPILYCVDTTTIIRFFEKIKKFRNEDSQLYMINPDYMENFGEVKNFVAHKSPYTLFAHKELTILPDPDLDMILAWRKLK